MTDRVEALRARIIAAREAFQQKHGWCGIEHRLSILNLIGKYWREAK